jgi:tripartite-type tricarboxylate transporter receptor subunit TctC
LRTNSPFVCRSPSLDAPTRFAVVVRTPTPAPILARLRTEFNAVIASEGYSKALERNSMEVLAVAPDAADQFLARERKLWSDAVKVTGVALD